MFALSKKFNLSNLIYLHNFSIFCISFCCCVDQKMPVSLRWVTKKYNCIYQHAKLSLWVCRQVCHQREGQCVAKMWIHLIQFPCAVFRTVCRWFQNCAHNRQRRKANDQIRWGMSRVESSLNQEILIIISYLYHYTIIPLSPIFFTWDLWEICSIQRKLLQCLCACYRTHCCIIEYFSKSMCVRTVCAHMLCEKHDT